MDLKMSIINYCNNSFGFEFEKNFDHQRKAMWVKQHYWLPFIIVACYLIVIYSLKNIMKSKEAMQLNKPMFVWNIFLAVLSTVGVFRSYPAMFYDWNVFGFHYTVCEFSNVSKNLYFWGYIAAIFKFLEFTDTIFVVLRKHKLIVLHWYHHATVFFSAWFALSEMAAPVKWMGTINATVHAVMYSYYAVRALDIKVPRIIAMCITLFQIWQMIAGTLLCVYIGVHRYKGYSCGISDDVAKLFLIMYITYFILFVNYFYWTYVSPRYIKRHTKVKEH